MPRFIVLLRGVNVGKGRRVPMAGFKALLEQLGYANVKTLLNSGNAAFDSSIRSAARHSVAIAASLQEQLGVATLTIVKSAAEMSAIVGGNPMLPTEGESSRSFVAFAADPAALQGLAALQSLLQPSEHLAITPQAAYLHCPDGILQSRVGAAMLGKVGQGITTRNWATVLKIRVLMAE